VEFNNFRRKKPKTREGTPRIMGPAFLSLDIQQNGWYLAEKYPFFRLVDPMPECPGMGIIITTANSFLEER
jgi:hypothetical protein